MNVLENLRVEEARLRRRIERLNNENSSNSSMGNYMTALGIGVGILSAGLAPLAGITVGLAYSIPGVSVGLNGNLIDDKLEESNEELTNNLEEQEYQKLQNEMNSTKDQKKKQQIANEIGNRHLDRYVRDRVREMERDVQSRDRSRDYDHVRPSRSSFDGDGSTAYA